MAESDFTATPEIPTNKSRSALEIDDDIDCHFNAAIAIIDCVKVLSALDHSVQCENDQGLPSGDGMAAGYQVCDASMPDALHHAIELLRNTRKLIAQKTKLADSIYPATSE